MPEQGRIRTGIKTAKAMKALTAFRFTSHDRAAIEALGELYGGTMGPWEDQWELVSDAAEINVVLPPDPLRGTPIYELWSGGGVVRRCDGTTCQLAQPTNDGAEMVSVPCVCVQNDALACSPITRLSVILPEIRFGGTWRLETKGWNAAHELPGMVELVESVQQRGLTRALLALEKRTSKSGGKTRKFVVPVLRLAASADQLVAGEASLRGLVATGESGGTEPAAIGAGTTALDDDDIIEAEVIEVQEVADTVIKAKELQRIAIMTRELFDQDADDYRHGLCMVITNGRTATATELDAEERQRMILRLGEIKTGKWRVTGVDNDGLALVEKV